MTLNGHPFREMPIMCGNCPFFVVGSQDTMGWCTAFAKHKSKFSNIPELCSGLFEKAFQMGGDLVIVLRT